MVEANLAGKTQDMSIPAAPPPGIFRHDDQRTRLKKPKKITKGADATSDFLIGSWKRRSQVLRQVLEEARHVEALTLQWRCLDDEALDQRMEESAASIRRRPNRHGEPIFLALSLVSEAMRRVTGMTPHTVQLAGALAMSHGTLAEMATGEGKTLTVCLWAAVAAWCGFPVHVVTANDYLAARDAQEMAPFYRRCGLRVSAVVGESPPDARAGLYGADVVYTTSKELLADFLKDRLILGRWSQSDQRLVRRLLDPQCLPDGQLAQRGLHTVVVDEADNVLIDEAVIPLRISQKYRNEPLRTAYLRARDLCAPLSVGNHYLRLEKEQSIRLQNAGWDCIRPQMNTLPVMWRGERRCRELIEQTLVAREFFLRDKHYVVDEDKIKIVDTFSGRLMPDRSWSQGLHQAIEAKENVELSDPTATLAGLSFQRFFRYFKRISGLSGTAWEAAGELWQIYRLPVLRIPTHRPCIRREETDVLLATREEKWRAVVGEIKRLHSTGRPLLVGTSNVADSEHLAGLLEAEGITFSLLNAVRSITEAEIIARAGHCGMLTIATNMAGRGTDIKLGPGAAALGGLMVLATERHESRRIDRQLFGRAGRHGDPGGARAFTSLEDDLIQKHGVKWLVKPLGRALTLAPILIRPLALWFHTSTQKKAESRAFFIRKMVIESDTQADEALSFAGGSL